MPDPQRRVEVVRVAGLRGGVMASGRVELRGLALTRTRLLPGPGGRSRPMLRGRWAALTVASVLLCAVLVGTFAVPAEAAASPVSTAGASMAAGGTSVIAGSVSAGDR